MEWKDNDYYEGMGREQEFGVMGRRYVIVVQEEGGGGGGFGWDEELFVIRFYEVLNWKCNCGVEWEFNFRLVCGWYYVVLVFL